jgi:four helix bundle protein
MHNLKELKVWNKAIDLTVKVYQATENFPKEEKYGLTSQIRRSAVSVPSNISEGAGRIQKVSLDNSWELPQGLHTNYKRN